MRSLERRLGQDSDTVLRKALARRKAERHATALEMVAAIRAATAVAEPEEVAALVQRVTHARLVARRRAVEEALLHLADDETDAARDADADRVAQATPGATLTARAETAQALATAPRKPGWLGAVGLALLAANVVGWSLLLARPPMPPAPSASATPGASTSTAPSPSPSTPTSPSAERSADERRDGAGPSEAQSANRGLASPSVRVSPRASASAKPELHGSPYGAPDGGTR